MNTANENDVPVTREGAIVALKLVMIVLAAAVFWQSALAVNAELHAHHLVTAPPLLKGAASLIGGTETGAPFPERLGAFLARNHRLAALGFMMAAVLALVVRFVALGRIFDYLYLESEARERRVYSGLLVNILLILCHAGALYGLVSLGGGDHAAEAPLALLALLALNFVWFSGILLSARRVERHSLRGVAYLAGTTLTAGVLFCVTWVLEGIPVSDPAVRGSQLVFLSAMVALILCVADGYLQHHIYWTDMPVGEVGSGQANGASS